MKHWPSDLNAALPQLIGGTVDIRFINGECHMLRRPFPFILLKDNHAVRSTGAQKHPGPSRISEPFFKAQYVSIEGFRSRKLLHTDGNLVDTTDGWHNRFPFVFPSTPLSSRLHRAAATNSQRGHTTLAHRPQAQAPITASTESWVYDSDVV
jgi:hypothetical protein